MVRPLFYLLLFLSFISIKAVAQTSAESQLIAILGDLHSMQASFTQTISDQHGNTIQQSNGKMALQRPGLFHWETTEPNQQLIIADGKFIWIYDKDLRQVIQQKQNINGNSASNAPGILLTDTPAHLAKRFTIQNLKSDDSSNIFRLAPKGKRDLFQSVTLYFNKNSLYKMELQDSLSQQTLINFNNTEINSNLSPHLFEFKKLKDVDLIPAT